MGRSTSTSLDAFRQGITSELDELGLVTSERTIAAAYAIWSYARPDGVCVLVGPSEGEAFGYAWRALEAAGIEAAPTWREPAGRAALADTDQGQGREA